MPSLGGCGVQTSQSAPLHEGTAEGRPNGDFRVAALTMATHGQGIAVGDALL